MSMDSVAAVHRSWKGLEPGFSPDVITALDALGHPTRIERTMGSVQSILRANGQFHGAADPRRPNAAARGLMFPPANPDKQTAPAQTP